MEYRAKENRTISGIIFIAILCVAAIQAGCQSTRCGQISDKQGFISLFDGKTLNGWIAYKEAGEEVVLPESGFEVQDGCIHVTGCGKLGKAYWLATKEAYGDFTLRLECKLTDKANSGIFVRSPGPDFPAYKGFEIQILDTYGEAPTATSAGAIYDILTPMRNMGSKPGEWNQVEVTCRGRQVVIIWNGFSVINADLGQLTQPVGQWKMAYADKPLKGILGLQNHCNELWFRNIQIKKLN